MDTYARIRLRQQTIQPLKIVKSICPTLSPALITILAPAYAKKPKHFVHYLTALGGSAMLCILPRRTRNYRPAASPLNEELNEWVLSYKPAAYAPRCRNHGYNRLFQFKLKIGENEKAFKVLWSVKELRKPSGVQTASGQITCQKEPWFKYNERKAVNSLERPHCGCPLVCSQTPLRPLELTAFAGYWYTPGILSWIKLLIKDRRILTSRLTKELRPRPFKITIGIEVVGCWGNSYNQPYLWHCVRRRVHVGPEINLSSKIAVR